ncbi:MAG: energy transducer TonB, partial [Mucilaginibacter sp.]|uniref:energy transducer TonB n=1 Tax=Mucilaginibacter sp. TaxID=1882438 RepID=UPI0026222811
KEYGAYYLRQHYADNIVKAMGITFLSVFVVAITCGIIIRQKPVELVKTTVVKLSHIFQPPPVEPIKEIAKSKPSAPKQLVNTTKFVPPVVTTDPVKADPPKIDNMKGDIGPVEIDIPGAGTGINIDAGKTSNGSGTKAEEDNSIHPTTGVEVMPEPYGGAAAWAKFLQKNLQYPGEAVDKGISGKVWVSFVVEKDGRLSSFVIEKGAGYGMDEEALRVLKKAPAWKPGMQNGQPVRVKYTLPLSFVLSQ